MAILDADDYPSIRAAIDVKLGRQELPDDIIEQDIFIGAAEAELVARYPTAASATGNDLLRVKRAAVWLTAARLVHSVVRVTSMSVQNRDFSYSRATFNPDEMAAELRGRADRELAMLETPDAVTPSRPTMFAVASGDRGR